MNPAKRISPSHAIGSAAMAAILWLTAGACSDFNYRRNWSQLEPWAALTRPAGEGPFPAVVLLHGCGGMGNRRDNGWAERLASWGYVSLQVDSFAPRGISGVCAGGMISMEILPYRVSDAHAAREHLAGLDFVDPDRIAVMGWSHGGSTTLRAVRKFTDGNGRNAFRAAVAFYPHCSHPLEPLAPLLILAGDRDRWTPVEFCLRHAPTDAVDPPVGIEVYAGAHHCFDWVGIDTLQNGHVLRYHPRAALAAFAKVRTFLATHLAAVDRAAPRAP